MDVLCFFVPVIRYGNNQFITMIAPHYGYMEVP
jgi:hypothetical protein